jgi:DNA polymerase-3 subunit alpha
VCSVGYWITYQPRSAMSDVARVMGGDFRKVIQISKGLPDEFDDLTLQDHKELMLKARDDGDARRDIEQYKEFYSYWADDTPADVNDPDSSPKRIVECAYRLVDKIKAQGTHAGGVIIADCPIDSIVPLSFIKSGKKEGVWTSQWTEGLRSTQLSKFGLIKFDILGLKTMQYIWVACNFVRENRGISIDFDDLDPTIDKAGSLVRGGVRENISFCDELTLKMINDLKTESVFQIETPIQKGIIRDGKVKSFNDLVVYNAMGRPGPIECCKVGSLINVDSGYIKIEELNYKNNKIAYMSNNGIKYTSQYRVFNNGRKMVYKIKLSNGKVIHVTNNHKIMTKYGFREVKNINKGDIIYAKKENNRLV